jgi:hypothetical protein
MMKTLGTLQGNGCFHLQGRKAPYILRMKISGSFETLVYYLLHYMASYLSINFIAVAERNSHLT